MSQRTAAHKRKSEVRPLSLSFLPSMFLSVERLTLTYPLIPAPTQAAALTTTASAELDTRDRAEQMRRDIAPSVTTLLQQQGELVVLPETADLLADIAAAFMVDLAVQSAQMASAVAAASPGQSSSVPSAMHVAAVVRRHPVMHSKASHVVQVQQQTERPAGGV